MDNIIFNRLFAIDAVNNISQSIELNEEKEELRSYITELIHHVEYNPNSKAFNFENTKNTTKDIISKLAKLCNDEGNEIENYITQLTSELKDKLLVEEVKTQEKIQHLKHDVLKGVLVFTMLRWGEGYKLIISKADNDQFLDTNDFLKKMGLPLKKRIYKAVIFKFDIDGTPEELIKVFDTSEKVVKYWWDGFLELKSIRSDEENTVRSFDAIDTVFSKYKNEYREDYILIRNSTVKYFRTKETFKLEDLLNEVSNYTPVNASFNVNELKEKIEKLPEKKGFDSMFELINKKITARFLNVITLAANLELHIKQDIPDLRSRIKRHTSDTGEKGIFIISESGYESFPEN